MRSKRGEIMPADANKAWERSWLAGRSNAQGRLHENLIEVGCRYYKQIGRAKVEKMPEPFRVVSKGKYGAGRALVHFIAHAEPDFVGCLAGGRCIAFEAKYTSTERMRAEVITPTQAAALNDYEDRGAVAAVCAGIGDYAYITPWRAFRDMKKHYGHAYITREDVCDYQVSMRNGILFLDYIHLPGSIANL